jgi:hypothetical protein
VKYAKEHSSTEEVFCAINVKCMTYPRNLTAQTVEVCSKETMTLKDIKNYATASLQSEKKRTRKTPCRRRNRNSVMQRSLAR